MQFKTFFGPLCLSMFLVTSVPAQDLKPMPHESEAPEAPAVEASDTAAPPPPVSEAVSETTSNQGLKKSYWLMANGSPVGYKLEVKVNGNGVTSVRGNEPALDLFPTRAWSQIAGRVLRRGETILATDGAPLGYLPLREAIADYLGAARGVRCRPEQVAIVSGVQEALDLTTRLLVDPGDCVVLEEPGYDGAERVFSAAGARIVSVAIDGEGMRVPSARLRDARLAYVTPAHQFPTGVAMSLPRRLALLEWARRAKCRSLEDDYDS